MATTLRNLYQRFRLHILVLLAAGFGSAAVWIYQVGFHTDRWMLRQFFLVRGPVDTPQSIVIVAVDDASLDESSYTLPRSVLAQGLESIANANPKLLLIDMTFYGDSSKGDTSQKIARVLSSVPSVIGKTSVLDKLPSGPPELDPLLTQSAKFVLPMYVTATDGRVQFMSINLADSSTFYNRIPLAKSLPEELFDHSLKPPGEYDLINFYGGPGTIHTVALSDIINHDSLSLEEIFGNKIVFVGFKMTMETPHTVNLDQFEISASHDPMYGVEIHATIIGNLLERSWIHYFDFTYTVGVIFLISALLFIVLVAVPPLTGYLLILILMLVLSVVNYLLFSWGKIWVGGLTTLWLIALSSVLISVLCRTTYMKRIIRLKVLK